MNAFVLKCTQFLRGGEKRVSNTCSYYWQLTLAYLIMVIGIVLLAYSTYGATVIQRVTMMMDSIPAGRTPLIMKDYSSIPNFDFYAYCTFMVFLHLLIGYLIVAIIFLIIENPITETRLFNKIKNKLCKEIEPRDI